MKTKNRLGETERGYKVIIIREGKINLSLPCTGCALLTGKEAIKTMTEYNRRGFETIAETESFGNVEYLDLDEMKEIVIQ